MKNQRVANYSFWCPFEGKETYFEKKKNYVNKLAKEAEKSAMLTFRSFTCDVSKFCNVTLFYMESSLSKFRVKTLNMS